MQQMWSAHYLIPQSCSAASFHNAQTINIHDLTHLTTALHRDPRTLPPFHSREITPAVRRYAGPAQDQPRLLGRPCHFSSSSEQ
eukprot:3822810-Rhodomonas_salina.2